MNTQILLECFCAPPLQTLVEPHFNFCLHLHLGSFSVFACPPHPHTPETCWRMRVFAFHLLLFVF